jgi:hypothetical protein
VVEDRLVVLDCQLTDHAYRTFLGRYLYSHS